MMYNIIGKYEILNREYLRTNNDFVKFYNIFGKFIILFWKFRQIIIILSDTSINYHDIFNHPKLILHEILKVVQFEQCNFIECIEILRKFKNLRLRWFQLQQYT